MDDTRIDAAPTPAHIFAYRAFRSVFVRSPESSPVRQQPTEEQHPNDNKENTRHAATRGSRFVTLPVLSKRDAELASGTLNLSLTPKRQCVNPVSPTKSILKKSNVPTPRRAGLRDATVTFKDIRMSSSPELKRRTSPTKVRSQPELKATFTSLSSVGLSVPVLRPSTATRVEDNNVVNQEAIPLQADAGFDLDGYIAQTEKEMRRLIKYGQKWRAQAKKQEEDNARLKAQLEELQKENDRLRGKDSGVHRSAKFSISTDITKPSAPAAADTEQLKPKASIARSEIQIRRPSQEKWKVPFGPIDTKKQRTRPSDVPERAEKRYEIQPDLVKSKHTATRQSETRDRINKQIVNEVPQRLTREVDPRQPKDTSPPFNSIQPREKDVHNKIQPVPESSTAAPIPPPEEDRKAAARERLRLKREARGASVRAFSAPVSMATKFGHDAKGDEESQVDWMAIA